jgi:GNAT superfamily N-acetyltransferase
LSLAERQVAGAGRSDSPDDRPAAAMPVPMIRCLRSEDEGELNRLLLGLEPSARNARFHQAVSDAFMPVHAKSALATADWVVGAFEHGCLRGVVEIYSDKPDGNAEAAFVVEQVSRRRGLGAALLEAAMQIAADGKTCTIRMMFSRHNWPMRKLASKAGGRLDVIFDSISVEVDLRTFRKSQGGLGRRHCG